MQKQAFNYYLVLSIPLLNSFVLKTNFIITAHTGNTVNQKFVTDALSS